MDNNLSKSGYLLLVAALTLLVTLPFINQAVHLDDWVYLTGAEELYHHPHDALTGEIDAFGQRFHFYQITHPPLLCLYLLLIRAAAGTVGGTLMHIGYLVFSLLAALASFVLARRFTGSDRISFYASLLIIFSPAFMVMSHTLMTDMPLLAFFLATLAAYIYGLDREDKFYLVLSSLFFTLALLSAYQALFLFPLLFIYTFLKKPRFKILFLVSLVPAVSLAIWFIYVFVKTGTFHLAVAFDWTGLKNPFLALRILSTLVGSLCVIGAATIFPLGLIYISWRPRAHIRAYGMMSAVTLYLLAGVVSDYGLGQKISFAVFFFAGLLASYTVLSTLLRIIKGRGGRPGHLKDNCEQVFLCLWYLGYLAAVVILLPQGIARYLLPALFPLVIIVLAADPRHYKTGFMLFLVVSTLVMGSLSSLADYHYAGLNKDIASQLKQRFDGRDIFFVGDLGLRYHLEQAGYSYLVASQEYLKPGQLVVETGSYLKGTISAKLKANLEPLDEITYYSSRPLVLMSKIGRADFYSSCNGWGFLPYFFNRPGTVVESFKVYRYIPHRTRSLLSGPAGRQLLRQGSEPPHTSFNNLRLIGWQINPNPVNQDQGLEVVLRWRCPDGFAPGFVSFLFLDNPHSPLLLSPGSPAEISASGQWSEASVIEETYTVGRLSRDRFPGQYDVYVGLVAAAEKEGGPDKFSLAQWPHYKLGSIEVNPSIYDGDPVLLRRPSYLPWRPRLFGPRKSFSLSQDKEVVLTVSDGLEASSLRLISFLAYGATLGQGEAVAEVTVLDAHGQGPRFLLRAGQDTADWYLDNPRYDKSFYQHQKADIFSRWPSCQQGECFWQHTYITHLNFTKPIIPAKIIVRYLNSQGVLIVEDIALVKKIKDLFR
jgi:4-amino-4-deoxy-L-arabinose transferase-like glycosyltransferase